MKNYLIKENLIPYFQNNSNILLVYLFGSSTYNNTGPLSDLDCGIYTDKVIDYIAEFKMAHEIGEILDFFKVHVVNLNRAFPALKYNVIHGEILFCRDEKIRIDFESKTLNEYLDFLPVLKRQRKELAYG